MDIRTIQKSLPTTPLGIMPTQPPTVPFQDILAEAMTHPIQSQGALIAQALTESDRRQKAEAPILIAQALNDPLQNPVIPQQNTPLFTAKNINEEGLKTSKLEVTPVQFFMEKGIELFQKISAMEQRSDQLMEQYARGEISIEEMSIEKAKVGVALSLAVTLVTQVTQAFNELKNMQI